LELIAKGHFQFYLKSALFFFTRSKYWQLLFLCKQGTAYLHIRESNENLKYFLSHNLLNAKGTQ